MLKETEEVAVVTFLSLVAFQLGGSGPPGYAYACSWLRRLPPGYVAVVTFLSLVAFQLGGSGPPGYAYASVITKFQEAQYLGRLEIEVDKLIYCAISLKQDGRIYLDSKRKT